MNKMRYLLMLIAVALSGIPFLVNANTIAKCGSSEGNAYWHNAASNTENKSNWTKDKINSSTTLIRTAKNEFDILVVDKFGNVSSFVQDGGQVHLLRRGATDATFIHIHPGKVIELYTFWKSRDGEYNFDILLSKGGDEMLYHFSAVMTGKCGTINFNLIN